jgi:hypothetical protein
MLKNATFLPFYFADNHLFSNSETLVTNCNIHGANNTISNVVSFLKSIEFIINPSKKMVDNIWEYNSFGFFLILCNSISGLNIT